MARDIVVRLYRLAKASGVNPDTSDYLHSGLRKRFPDQQLEIYRDWLRNHLEGSDVLHGLLDGEDRLASLAAALPPVYQPLHRLFAPRRLEGRLELLLRNLEWFLNPSNPPIAPASAYGSVLVFSSTYWILTIALTHIPQFRLQGGIFLSAVQWLSFLALLMIQIAISSFMCGNLLLAGISKNDRRYQVNAVELYRYALERLSDAPEPVAVRSSGDHPGELDLSIDQDSMSAQARARIT